MTSVQVPLEDKAIWEDSEVIKKSKFYYFFNQTNIFKTILFFNLLKWCQESLGEEVLRMGTDEIVSRTRLLDNEIKIMKSDVMRIGHELQAQNEKIKENTEKIKVNKTLPYLVSNVIEVLFFCL